MMSLINDTRVHFSDRVHDSVKLTKLDVQLLRLWQAYRSLPDWAIKHVLIVPLVTGIITNTLLLIYFFKSGKYRIPVFTTLTSLAVCDWLTCLGTVATLTVILPNVAFQNGITALCRFIAYILPVTYESSVCHLIFLAVLRYFQLCYPLWSKVNITFSLVARLCSAMWLACFLITIPYLPYIDVHWVPYNNGSQLGIMHFTGNSNLKDIGLTVFCQIIPLVALAVLHGLKMFKLSRTSELTKQDRRSASSRTVTLIIGLFVVSIVPRLVHTFYHSVLMYPYLSFHFALYYYTIFLTYGNSIINPWVYLLGSREIRSNIMDTFCNSN